MDVPGEDHGSAHPDADGPCLVPPGRERILVLVPSSYRRLLGFPGAAAFFLSAGLGRVGIAMTSLGLVWLVHAGTGRYADAGVVTGAFALAEGLVGPQLARLVDRYGQARVLPGQLAAHGVAVALLIMLVGRSAPLPALVLIGVVAGASMPQLGALSATRWSVLLRRDGHEELLPTAFALESVANGLSYLVGPVLVSAVGAAGHPAYGSGLAAALVVGGGLTLAAQRATAPPAGPRQATDDERRGLLRPTFVLVAIMNLGLGIYFGSNQVAVTAFATATGRDEVAPVLFAVSSGTGLVVGYLYGSRRWPGGPTAQLAVATGAVMLAAVGFVVVDRAVTLGTALVLAGAAIPVVLVLLTVLVERDVDRTSLTQAFTWLNSASAAGSAAAAALAGGLVDGFGSRGGFVLTLAAATSLAAMALIIRRATATSPSPQPAEPTR